MYAIIFHAHQKLDRVALKHLRQLLPADNAFPTFRQIARFEAGHGPDGAKLKRHSETEQPWHFIDPHDAADSELNEQISFHYNELVAALRQRDQVGAAFQAAWLAHALVDGLTPAHHHPYEAELLKLRGGEPHHTRKGLVGRLYVQSDTLRQSVRRSVKLIGPKGLLTTHALFEAGAYAIIAPLKLRTGAPSSAEVEAVTQQGVLNMFQDLVREVAGFHIYDRFYARGWTQALSQDVKRELAPRMVRMITLAWYAAYYEAERPIKKSLAVQAEPVPA